MNMQRGSPRDPDVGGIEEIVAGPSAGGRPIEAPRPITGPGGGASGRAGSRRRGLRRWLPVVAVAGIAVAIVGAGLVGPKVPSAESPGVGDPAASPAASPGAGDPGTAAATPAVPAAQPPRLRIAGSLPADRFLLLGGRWVDLATGAAVGETGCELERPLVLTGGRIVCVARQKGRPPGSTWATYELSAVTLGRARPVPADPWPASPPPVAEGVRPAVSLTSLVGRRDLAFGDPVAVAVAAGPARDDVLLAWAVLGEGGYRVGLDRYRVGDAATIRVGSREILTHPLEDEQGLASLADLSVRVAPGGGAALVGVTIARNPPTAGVRRLAVLTLGAGATAEGPGTGRTGTALPGGAVEAPVMLPPEATGAGAADGAGATDGPGEAAGAPCGGSLGEGWVSAGLLYVVCPGPTAGLRVLAAGTAEMAEVPAAGPGDVVSTGVLDPGGTQAGPGWLAGNGVVVDPAGPVTYRWSPAAGTLWRIAVDRAGRVAIRSLAVDPRRGSLDPGDEPPAAGTIPVLALDAAAGRLYALDAPVPGAGGRAVVHLVDVERWSHVASFPLADPATRAIALGPDGRFLYATTSPRDDDAGRPTAGVAVLDSQTGIEVAYAGRLPAGARRWLEAVIVR